MCVESTARIFLHFSSVSGATIHENTSNRRPRLVRRLCGDRGSAGCCAQWAQTLLIERTGFSGGIITTVGLPYYDGLIDSRAGVA
jgi:hypothetical protein